MSAYIRFENVTKVYGGEGTQTYALKDASFEIEEGEFCVIVGPSGAGKTTILNIMGGIDRCSKGAVYFGEKNLAKMNEWELTVYRRRKIGFVFQFYNLIGNLTALENVELASEICNDAFDPSNTLDDVELSHRKNHFPAQLSGGEQQRVSIARALAKNPKLLLCDEPTGALDNQTGQQILKLLERNCREKGMTVVLITHNTAITDMAHRIISVSDGRIVKIGTRKHPFPVEKIRW